MKSSTAIILLILSFSCKQSNTSSNETLVFKTPVIVQPATKDSIHNTAANFMRSSLAKFVGKQKFTDTLYIPGNSAGGTWEFRDDLIDRHSNALSTDCFELIPDYSTSVYQYNYDSGDPIGYYPVFIVNQTSDSKALVGKDDHAFGLQEALDKEGQWRPIEASMSDFCGNGHWRLKIHQQEFITLLFRKYSGDFKTKIRVRINNGDNVYVSKPYDGTICEDQFYMRKETYLYETSNQDLVRAFQRLFYGAKPPLLGE